MVNVSVIMPVYNASEFLAEAIESILTQSFTDFEFIIINDGSTDDSAQIIQNYSDERIVFINDAQNIGYTNRLNQAIKISNGEYIARMDADDISHPLRLEKQIIFLEKNKSTALCGTFIKIIGNTAFYQNWIKHTNADSLKLALLFGNAICHPSVMFRKSILQKENLLYDHSYEPAEDYKLWTTIAKFAEIANLPDVLFSYRAYPNQVSQKRNDLQEAQKTRIILDQLAQLNLHPSKSELLIHKCVYNSSVIISYDYLKKLHDWLNSLKQANRKFKIYPSEFFELELHRLETENITQFQNELKKLDIWRKSSYLMKYLLGWESIK